MTRLLRHIPAKQAKKYLSEVKVGTVSKLPNSEMILVTGTPGDLRKASAILTLVDSKQEYVVKAISPIAEARNLPPNSMIAAEFGDISIGTFSNPPISAAETRAIIDIHKDSVIAIVPAENVKKIMSIIKRLQETATAPTRPMPTKLEEPSELNLPILPSLEDVEKLKAEIIDVAIDAQQQESDELFDSLLKSIEEAEEKSVEEKPAISQPTPPEIIPPVAQPIQPTEPAVDLERADPQSLQTDQQLDEPNLPATPEDKKPEAKADKEPEKVVEKEIPKSKQIAPSADGPIYTPAPVSIAEEELELNLPEKLQIVDLLDLVGKHLQLDYMFNEADLKGKQVSLRIQGPIKVKELYPLLEAALKSQGLAMARKGNLVTIVPSDKILEIDPTLVGADDGQVRYGDVIITRIFQLKHIDTESAKNLLTGMKLGMHINPIPDASTLIVTGFTYRMQRIEEFLQMIDIPGEPRKFRFKQLKYTLAETLAPKIQALAEQLGTISISVSTPTKAAPKKKPRRAKGKKAAPKPVVPGKTEKAGVFLDVDERTNRILMIGLEEQLAIVEELIDTLDVKQQDLRSLRVYDMQYVDAEEVQMKLSELGIISGVSDRGRTTSRRITPSKSKSKSTTTAKTEEALSGEPQVVILESTNSLMINATPEQHAKIAVIIGYVDTAAERSTIPYVIYPLENQDPMELAGVLEQLIQKTVTSKGKKDDKVKRTTTKTNFEEDITIVPDEKSYSLIVYASKKNQQWISAMIKQLDEYRAQVLLDVTLVAITRDDKFKFGLDILTKYPTLSKVADITGGGGFLGLIGGTGNPVQPFNGRFWEADSTAGSGSFFYNDDHIQALLTAVKERNWGRVLSSPKLLVNDNEEGKITQTRKIYITETDVTNVPTASTSTITTQVKFTPYTTGLDLSITPHISKGNQLRLEISLKRDDFDGEPIDVTVGDLTVQKPADERSNTIETTVTVPDGYTIILGGIETISQGKAGSKIPILGDIPLIGGLFNSINNADTQTKLYIFVKANILRPTEYVDENTDIVRISKKQQAEFEELENRFQRRQNWPGIDPDPMYPVKVLEAD